MPEQTHEFVCKTCGRKMRVPADEHRENPHCRRCLNQRLRAESPGRPVRWIQRNGYLEIQVHEKQQ